MQDALIKVSGGRTRIVPLTTLRLDTHLGTGTVRYVTDDGWVGLHLDSDPEARTEEVHLDHLAPAQRAAVSA